MPPSLSRSSLSSLARCKSCPPLARTFSSSTPLSKIGPESPKFIEIPRLVQPFATPKVTIKGVLPPPRNLFPRRAGDKTSDEYLSAATPEPNTERALAPATTPYVAWKRNMAESRRQNLRDSLVQLHARKTKSDRIVSTKSTIRMENREKRLHAPLREDERLTNSTVTATMRQLTLGNLPDPHREVRLAASKARIAERKKRLEEERRDALHTLYMHARSFITNEAQLEEEIEIAFGEKNLINENGPKRDPTKNIWEKEGAPQTVQDMLNNINNTSKDALKYYAKSGGKTGKRMVKIAEELTGGKMDV